MTKYVIHFQATDKRRFASTDCIFGDCYTDCPFEKCSRYPDGSIRAITNIKGLRALKARRRKNINVTFLKNMKTGEVIIGNS